MTKKAPTLKSTAEKALKLKGRALVDRLKEIYPDATCALQSGGDPFRLLVMGMLSAQCTDMRVNLVSRDLFAAFPDAQSMAQAPLGQIEALIRSCGLYQTKAKNIKAASQMLLDRFDGQVPCEMEDLLCLPGVGRKIANLLRGDLFGLPAIVTDTHCIRLAGRFGFCDPTEKNPLKIEKILVKAISPAEQSDFCHRLVWFGRETCTARNPKCENCPCRDLCGGRG